MNLINDSKSLENNQRFFIVKKCKLPSSQQNSDPIVNLYLSSKTLHERNSFYNVTAKKADKI